MTSGCRASPPGRRCYRIPLEYALSALPGSSMRDFMSQHRRKPSPILGKMVRCRVDDNRRRQTKRVLLIALRQGQFSLKASGAVINDPDEAARLP